MQDIFSKLDGGEILGLCGIIVGLVALVGGLGVGFSKVLSEHYRKTQLDEMEATLKMEMIQRGMSADEISKVLEAKMGSSKSVWQDVLCKLPKMPAAPAMRSR
jgi:predicted metalloprotease